MIERLLYGLGVFSTRGWASQSVGKLLPLPTCFQRKKHAIRDVGMTHRFVVKRVRAELIDVNAYCVIA